MAKGLVIGRRRDGGTQCWDRIERAVSHTEWAEDLMLAEARERLVGETAKSNAQQNESDVAVFGMRTGIVDKRRGVSSSQEFVASAGAQEKLLVGGQAGRMGEQHAQGYFIAPGVFARKFTKDGDQREIEIQQAALVQDHCHGSGSHDLSERGEVKQRVWGGPRRLGIEGELSEGAQGKELARMGHGHRDSRKGVGCDRVAQNAECERESQVLVVVRGNGRGVESGQESPFMGGMTCPVIAKSEGWVKEIGRGTDGTLGYEVSLRQASGL